MDELTPQQLMDNLKAWEPGEDFTHKVLGQFKKGKVPDDLSGEMAASLKACAKSTYEYIQFIHRLATTLELDRENFLPQILHMVDLVKIMHGEGHNFQNLFRKYDERVRKSLQKDTFDTVYYDAIQSVDLRTMLKSVIDEVEVLLRSFSLVSADLSEIPCVDLYENSVRFQLFLQYFLHQSSFQREEMWSVLFDVANQMDEMRTHLLPPTAEELADLQDKIKKNKTN
jgi:hypothetical protein